MQNLVLYLKMILSKIQRKIRINLRKKKVVSILLIISLFLIFFYNFYGPIWGVANNISDKISEETGVNIGKIFYDFESAVNIFRPKKDLWSGDLPIFQLKLSEKDVSHFNELSKDSVNQGYLNKEENSWRDVKLKYQENLYDAKIKLHGDLSNHWANALKSYNVKIEDNESINGLKKFSLIIFEDRTLSPKIANILAEEFGLFDSRNDFVVLRMNGVPQGLYYLVEKLDNTFFEYNNCSSCEIIRTRDSKFKDHPREKISDNPNLDSWEPYGINYFRSQHVTPFDYEISHIDLEKSELDLKKIINSVNGLFQAVEEDDVSMLVNYFDIDQITSFEAQRMLLGLGQIMGDNLKLVYKATNSKFYPIGFEGGLNQLKVEKGGLERSLNIYTVQDDKEEIKLFSLLNRNDQIRQLKYKKAYNYILNEEDLLLDKITKLIDKYLPYANANKGNSKGTKIIEKEIKSFNPLLKNNLDIIKATLEYAKCYVNIVEKGNKISFEIIPDAVSQLKFNSFKLKLIERYSGDIVLEFKDEENNSILKTANIQDLTSYIDLTKIVEDFYFSTGLDEDLGTKKRIYKIEITFSNTNKIFIDNLELKVKNDITGKLLDTKEVYVQIANANDYYKELIHASPEEFINIYEEFNWDYSNNVITLLKGDYVLKRDFIIPKDLTFNIESGVQILIDDDKSIVSHSPVNILGIESEPVVIKASDNNKPFGTFGIVGEKGQKSIINWLRLSGGNEKFINGIYFSGGLSIHHMDVAMSNTIISDNHADDGLNIKYGKVLIDNCLFLNNFADQVDLDFTQGVVKNSQFKENNPDADSNGDGLDFSGSKIIAKNNLFSGFSDKGVSIGEETYVVLYDNKMTNNNLGVAVKDSSHAFFIENSFENNQIAISAYQKKIIYPSGGYSYLYNNDYDSNENLYESDEKSQKKDLELSSEEYDSIKKSITDEDIEVLFQSLDNFKI